MRIFVLSLLIGIFYACSPYDSPKEVKWKSIEKDLQLKLIQAQNGETIALPEGHFIFENSLIIDGLKNVTLKGAGIDKTILSFALQSSGAEGIKATHCSQLIFSDFTIQDAKGDNIKVSDTRGVKFDNVKSQWTGEPNEKNGAYAFYPVLCQNVTVENCVAIGASDAGIYVGQSDSVIIKDNEVFQNVAGIESENSRWVEIYNNHAHHNTGGILVFDMPGLIQSGHSTRVYNNRVTHNNYRNFAPKGNVVATVPSGTGIMLLATRKIEVFDNILHNNRSVGVAIASYKLVEALGAEQGSQLQQANSKINETYDPYPTAIYIHDNNFKNDYFFPTLQNDFGLLFLLKFPFQTPDIVIDGIFSDDIPFEMCISETEKIKFANLDAAHNFENLNTDLTPYRCPPKKIKALY